MLRQLKISLLFCAGLFACTCTFAQNKTGNRAYELLDKSLGIVFSGKSYAIYFEGITYSVERPLDIFTLPVYQVYRGGFAIMDNGRYEVQLGAMKSLCDGRIVVVVDEVSKMMVVDSVRNYSSGNDTSGSAADLLRMLDEKFTEAELVYESTEIVNGKSCHRLKGVYPKDAGIYVYYWIEEKTNKLLLMAEHQENGYFDVYWFREIVKAPKGHKFDVHLPDKYIENFHGYEVADFRYANDGNKRQN